MTLDEVVKFSSNLKSDKLLMNVNMNLKLCKYLKYILYCNG